MNIWIFIEKEKGVIVDIDVYGSVRKLSESKDIYIKGFKLPESTLRKILNDGGNKFVNDVYHIEKVELKTKKHS